MEKSRLNSFLEKVLLMELALPTLDIRANSWFHGQLNRKQAELLLTDNGHYLVRESNSQNGQYVLSCYFNEEHLHFMISKHESMKQLPQCVQYSFDGDLFDSVKQLVEHHLVSGQHITKTSDAIITKQVNRRLPLEQVQLTKYFENNSDKSIDELLKDVNSHTILPSPATNGTNSNCFLTDYLEQIEHDTSAIKLETSETGVNYLNDNSHFYINQIIVETGAEILASHLFKRNAKFVGLDFDTTKRQSNHSEMTSGIELLLLPTGKQMRRDIIIRHECLKYFVVTTILTATDSDNRLDILQKWIQVACELRTMFGDYFGFGSIMAGLCHDKVTGMDPMWTELRDNYANKWSLFENQLKCNFIDLLKANAPLSQNTSFPFVIQLCHLIESHFIQNSKWLAPPSQIDLIHIIESEEQSSSSTGLANFSIEDIFEHIILSTQILDNLSLFEANTRIAFEGFFFQEERLEELFKTQFHLKFLFNEDIDATHLTQANFRHLEEKIDNLRNAHCNYNTLNAQSSVTC